jgi:hypothetical protein
MSLFEKKQEWKEILSETLEQASMAQGCLPVAVTENCAHKISLNPVRKSPWVGTMQFEHVLVE